jgi:hypothetical protein
VITTSKLSFTDGEHSSREVPRLGCDCRACYEARQEHIEKELKALYEDESGYHPLEKQLPISIRLPIITRAIDGYIHGAVPYEAMKTRLIEQLWKMAQDHYKAECERASRAYQPALVVRPPETPATSGDRCPFANVGIAPPQQLPNEFRSPCPLCGKYPAPCGLGT